MKGGRRGGAGMVDVTGIRERKWWRKRKRDKEKEMQKKKNKVRLKRQIKR